mgnify:CR=1 FL=1
MSESRPVNNDSSVGESLDYHVAPYFLEWKKINAKLLQAAEEFRPKAERIAPKRPGRIFISWCEWNPENPSLVEGLLDPFLTALGFDVHFYKKDKRLGNPKEVIWSIMDECELMISLYTKDKDGSQAGNVVRETGRRLEKDPKNTVILCEEGIKVESLTYPDVLCMGFRRDGYGKLLLDLVVLLKNNCLLDV